MSAPRRHDRQPTADLFTKAVGQNSQQLLSGSADCGGAAFAWFRLAADGLALMKLTAAWAGLS